MSTDTTDVHQKRCFECQFEAQADDEQWSSVDHPPIGTMTQCPECGSTNIQSTQ